MAGDFRPFSLAEAAQGAAVFQNARANALALSAAQEKQQRLSPLLEAAAAGDVTATRQVVGIDPELGGQILNATSKMNEEQRNQFKHSVETKGRTLQAVMNAPELYREQAWQMAKEDIANTLGPDAVQGMPERFDPNWTQMNIDKSISVTKFLDTKKGSVDELTSSQKDFREYQRLLKTDPEAAKLFGKQAGFLSKEGEELSSHLQKRLSAASDEAVQSEAASNNYLGLAQDFELSGASGGLEGKWTEKMKELTGSEDAVSQFRQEYRQIRNTEAVKNLPPGVASDKDIQLALSGFPSDTSNAKYIAGFMRGMAKIAKARADYNDFKAQYISDNGTERGFLVAWKEKTKEQKLEEPEKKDNKETTQKTADVVKMSDDELLNF